MKQFILTTCIVISCTTAIYSKNFTETVREHAQTTFSTVTGKFETNIFTLRGDIDKCYDWGKYRELGYDGYNPTCIAQTLQKIQNEKRKNTKAIIDCFVVTSALELAAAGLKDSKLAESSKALHACAAPSSIAFTFLTVEQLYLWLFVESKAKNILSKK